MDAQQGRKERLAKRNVKMFGKLGLIAIMMFAFGYALVPLYQKICELTGINVLAVQESKTVTSVNSQIDRSRTVTIEFEMGWKSKEMTGKTSTSKSLTS